MASVLARIVFSASWVSGDFVEIPPTTKVAIMARMTSSNSLCSCGRNANVVIKRQLETTCCSSVMQISGRLDESTTKVYSTFVADVLINFSKDCTPIARNSFENHEGVL